MEPQKRASPIGDKVNKGMTMKMQTAFRRTMLAAALMGAGALNGTALAINEVEQNQGPLASVTSLTQPLSAAGDMTTMTEGATVTGTLGTSTRPDVDVFSFHAEKGRWVTIHIEAPTGGLVSFDGILTLLSNDGAWRVKTESFATPTADPIIEKYQFDRTGTWAVALSPFTMTFTDGTATNPHASLEQGSSWQKSFGSYKLVITPVAAPIVVVPVDIAVKPASAGRAPINPKAKGNIPVALLSSAEFDPLSVDVNSLTFGATGDEPSFKACAKAAFDFNADGRPDLLCHFDNELTNFVAGNAEAFLKGTFNDPSGRGARPILGRGPLKTLPAKRSN
jgi:hypothetical protein